MSQHDLLIINQSSALDAKEIDGLQRKGFSVISSNDLSAFEKLTAAPNQPILMANCSQHESPESFLAKLCTEKSLTPFPIIVLARDLEGLETKLNKVFPLALAVQQPADINRIIEAARFIDRNYRSSLPQVAETSGETEDSAVSKEDIDSSILYSNDLFSAVKDCQLSGMDLGGAELPPILSGRAKGGICKPFLPETMVLKEACEGFLSQLKAPVRAAVERINIFSLKILSPLGLEPEVLEIARAASILFSQSFAIHNRHFLTRDYSFKGAIVLRKELCSAIKDSALNLGGDLSERDLSRVVATIGKIIGQEDGGGDNQLSVAASAIVAADLLNRLCFQSIYWNASAAYRLLRRLRQGKIKFLHPAVCCIVLKLLAEALSSHINMKIMAPRKTQEELEKLQLSIRVHDETLVELPELTAGMRLSRPLLAEDGSAILAEDLILDDDLIMRIWQLSAIRLLDKAVIKRVS